MRKIIIALPEGIRRSGVKVQLEKQQWPLDDTCQNHYDLIRKLDQAGAAIVLLSTDFAGMHTKPLVRRILTQHAAARIVLWCERFGCALDFMRQEPNIAGYIFRDTTVQELVRCCNAVHLNQSYTAPVLTHTYKRFRKGETGDVRINGLSPREAQIFQLICCGLTVAEISERLFISRKTVNTFRYRLYRKLDVKGDVQLSHIGIAKGLFSPAAGLEDSPEPEIEAAMQAQGLA